MVKVKSGGLGKYHGHGEKKLTSTVGRNENANIGLPCPTPIVPRQPPPSEDYVALLQHCIISSDTIHY